MAFQKNAEQKNATAPTIPVITIDGPSGSGKGTIAQKLAAHLGWHWLDSGLLYRAVGFAIQEIFPNALENPSEFETKIVEILKDALEIHSVEGKGTQLYCLKKIIAPEILKSESIGRAASQLAVLPSVRQWLLQAQRIQRRTPGLVADGRDMGTVLFPDAQLKIYLTASVEERAQRRENQLKAMGINANFAELCQDLSERDRRDSERAIAPLKPAEDAVVIDSTELSIDQVLQSVIQRVII